MAQPAAVNPSLRGGPVVLDDWVEENKAQFAPPVCNKLMHKEQLSIMFVGGPNSRTDFHLDLGSEFFYQMRGNMSLPTIQKGKLKVVHIKEGQVFVLPSRVPHSPQREAGGLGLVIERSREDSELDGLRWYTDFSKCEDKLYERFFNCYDLGRDLVPVIQQYKASEAFKTGAPTEGSIPDSRPWDDNADVEVPDPFDLAGFLAEHAEELRSGADLNLFEGHPDGEFTVRVVGGKSTQRLTLRLETFFFQMKGGATISSGGKEIPLAEKACFVLGPGGDCSIEREEGSIGLVITQDPSGNR